MTTTPGPAEQQPKETAPAFEAFRAYLEQGPARSLTNVARQLHKSKALMARWSRRHGWQQRVREFEAEATRTVDDAHLTEIAKRARRQAEIAQLHGEATALVARAVVVKVAANPEILNGLALDELLRIEAAMARAHNRVVVTERLALGMTTNQDGEPLPRAAAEEQARRLTDMELDARLSGVDEVAEQREKRRVSQPRDATRRDVAGDA